MLVGVADIKSVKGTLVVHALGKLVAKQDHLLELPAAADHRETHCQSVCCGKLCRTLPADVVKLLDTHATAKVYIQ